MVVENASKGMDQLKVTRFTELDNDDTAMSEIQEALNLPDKPARIECYDISNIQGTNSVGSMVVFENGSPKTSEYRRFQIKTVEGVDDYYSRSSCGQYLRDIHIPTLILHAKDDPFSSVEAIPSVNQLSPRTILELSAHGGHVGFVQGMFPGREEYWLEKRIPEFISQYLTTEEIPLDRYREV